MSLYEKVDAAVDAGAAQVIAWRRDIHAHPELSNRERRTAAVVAEHLRSIGLDAVRTGIGGHGVVGVLRGGAGGDRVVALRADMDALPVREATGLDFASTVVDRDYPGGPFPVAHACGHDAHTAMLMGTASALAAEREHLPGTVLFVFQPAEEGPPLGEEGGAALMEREAPLDPRPGMVFGIHVTALPRGVVGYRVGNLLATSVHVRITVTGRQTHGSSPWRGIDPMPAAADIITTVGQLYRQVPAYHAVTVTIGHVVDEGRFNIIPERVTLYGTVRCTIESDMDDVLAKLHRTATHLAQAHACSADIEFAQRVPAVHNAPSWMDAVRPSLAGVVGPDRLYEMPPTLGYDDVSIFLNAYGGVYVFLGVQDCEIRDGEPYPLAGGRGVWTNHSPRFYLDEGELATGVRLHTRVALDYLTGVISSADG